MKVFIGADHRGFQLKNTLKTWLSERNISTTDVGAESLDPQDDYPVYAQKVAQNIASSWGVGREDSRGIVICGSGVGVDIVANKFAGVRCGLGINVDQVIAARRDDHINVLALAADAIDENQAKEMTKAFLETEYEDAERRSRRLGEIKSIENSKL